ncbi:MAG: hypothetical protein HY905_06685 [Deltaproteobacteria bacterium]|nr:hypothetical protein [Deltaproteobacteria bacterium]
MVLPGARVAWLGVLAVGVPAPAQAQATGPVADGIEEESLVTYAAELDFVSRYAWRGLAWSEGAQLQPYAEVAAFGASLWAWTNLVLQHEAFEGRFNEVDAGLGYDYAWDWLEVSAGLQVWAYPYQDDSPTTGQADVAIYVPVGPFSFYTRQTVDLGSYAGAWWGELGAEFAWETDAGPEVEAALLTGWASDKFNESYIGPAETTWNVVEAGFSVSFPFRWLYVRAHAQCSYLLDADLRAAVDDPFLVVGGIALGTEGPP